MKKGFFTLTLLFLSLLSVQLFAESQLSIDLGNPVYSMLEVCEIKGLISKLSAIRPYNHNQVERYLNELLLKEDSLTEQEVRILKGFLEEYRKESPDFTLAAAEYSELRLDVSNPSTLHSLNKVQAGIIGSLGDFFSYNLNFGLYLNRINREAFSPYEFTKQGDGIKTILGDDNYSTGESEPLNIIQSSYPEMSLDMLQSRINLKLSRTRREWGIGDGSLSFSSTARPIEALEGRIRLASWADFNFLTGTLGSWLNPNQEQKMFSIHRLELFPFNWLYLSVWESAVYAKRFELSYINPIMPYLIGQYISGDLDNVVMGGSFSITVSPFFRYYFSIFIDEIVILGVLDQFFQYPKNQYAWQTGFKIPLPGLPLSLLTLQYTKIEPYCYTHYLQKHPDYVDPVNINYTNDGENLGYYLPPNSDEFLVKFSSHPLPNLQSTLKYKLIRHGTGELSSGQIEGDINIPLDYKNLSAYPHKDFLHDGIYEWIHVITIGASYFFSPWKLTVWSEYSYVNARNYANIEGNYVVKNLFALGFSIKTR